MKKAKREVSAKEALKVAKEFALKNKPLMDELAKL